MKKIKIQCPAKINLTLRVLEKRDDGFHNIESVMQTINLYDYLTINVEPAFDTVIELSGNSLEIPYNEKNLVWKAAKLFFEKSNLPACKISIYIEKNIPVAAGLAGGSTNAAGTLYGLNEIFERPFNKDELHKLCAELGSDLNVCLEGGRILAEGRGEIITPLEFEELDVSLIKPESLGISAKEAYTKFSDKIADTKRAEFKNDLEWAVIDDYEELRYIKKRYPDSVMSGSGSTYFRVGRDFESLDGYWVYNGLKAVKNGVEIKLDPL